MLTSQAKSGARSAGDPSPGQPGPMEPAEIASKLRLMLERVYDIDHPNGWLESWSDEACELVEAAIEALERA